MAAGLGSNAFAGLNFETAWGNKTTDLTDGDDDAPWIDINSESLTGEERVLRSAALTGKAQLQSKVAQGARAIGGDIVWTPNYNSETLHRLFKAALGNHDAVDSYLTRFRPDVRVPGITAEVHMDITAIRFFGGVLNVLRGTITPDNFFDLTATWLFKDFEEIGAVDPSTITFDGADRATLIKGDHLTLAQWDPDDDNVYNIANVREFEFVYDNKWNPDRRVLGSRLINEPDRTEKLTTSGRAVVEFEDVTLFTDFYNQTRGDMLFQFKSGTDLTGSAGVEHTMQFHWPLAEIRTGFPVVNAFGIITLDVEWEGLEGTSGVFNNDAALVVSLVSDNQAPSYPANAT